MPGIRNRLFFSRKISIPVGTISEFFADEATRNNWYNWSSIILEDMSASQNFCSVQQNSLWDFFLIFIIIILFINSSIFPQLLSIQKLNLWSSDELIRAQLLGSWIQTPGSTSEFTFAFFLGTWLGKLFKR